MSNKVTLDERQQLEQLHNQLAGTPEPEDPRFGEDPAITEERDHEIEKVQAAITDEERDAMLRAQALQIEQLQETLTKLVASGHASPLEAAEQLNEAEMMRQQRRLYDRIRTHGDKVRIVIHSHPTVALNKPVPLGLNGKLRYVPRAQTVVVSAAELEILDNAIYNAEEDIVDPVSGNRQRVRNRIPSYPYSLVDHQFMENTL